MDDPELAGQHGEGTLGHGDVQVGAPAGPVPVDKGGEDGDRGPHGAAPQVGDLHARERRGTVRILAAHPQHPGQRQVVDVVPRAIAVGTVLPVPRNRAEDDAIVALVQRRVAHPQPVHHAGAKALDDYIGALRHPQEPLPLAVVLQIHRHRALVAVDREIAARRPVAARGEVAHVVAAAGFLYLDHVGAEVGEDHREEGAREKAGQVEHSDAPEGTRKGHDCDSHTMWKAAAGP